MEEEARSSPLLKGRYSDALRPTVGDVEVVAHGQAPHFSSDAGGNALPPQISHSTRCAPNRTVRRRSGEASRGTCLNHSTSCYSHCAPVRQDVLIPGLDGGTDALFKLAAILQLLLPLLGVLQLCNSPIRRVRQDGQMVPHTGVCSLPLFLAWATISSYCCLCFCASSAGFAGRLL